MSDIEVEATAGAETETESKHRGRVSLYPEEIGDKAQKIYRKVYNQRFKANQTILKAGGDIELSAKEAAIIAKNEYLVSEGFEPASKNVNRKPKEDEPEVEE